MDLTGLLELLAKVGIGYLIVGGVMGIIIFVVALVIIIKVFKSINGDFRRARNERL